MAVYMDGTANASVRREDLEEMLRLLRSISAVVEEMRRPVADPLDNVPWPHPGARTILDVLHDAGCALTREEIGERIGAMAWVSGKKIVKPQLPWDLKTVRKHLRWLEDRGLVEAVGTRIAISGLGRRFRASLPNSQTSQRRPTSLPSPRGSGRQG